MVISAAIESDNQTLGNKWLSELPEDQRYKAGYLACHALANRRGPVAGLERMAALVAGKEKSAAEQLLGSFACLQVSRDPVAVLAFMRKRSTDLSGKLLSKAIEGYARQLKIQPARNLLTQLEQHETATKEMKAEAGIWVEQAQRIVTMLDAGSSGAQQELTSAGAWILIDRLQQGHIEPIQRLLDRVEKPRYRFICLLWLADAQMRRGQAVKAVKLLDRAAALAGQEGTPIATVAGKLAMADLYVCSGAPDKAEKYLSAAIRDSEPSKDETAEGIMVNLSATMNPGAARILMMIGRDKEALSLAVERAETDPWATELADLTRAYASTGRWEKVAAALAGQTGMARLQLELAVVEGITTPMHTQGRLLLKMLLLWG